ncbi:SCO family protein [Bacteriovorax sp. Seq25_V]|uniref:SCO family protein n=1 Tax=Bacteriovorax sp. Seq25_V TaxID=1201288 RepID=UPI00038A1819|nr:SCO family protein [Bacteriovorax sp. Seq25_V]EQC43407.1 SCO1/SenC [Bacteriovorax sp. Seq25_V]
MTAYVGYKRNGNLFEKLVTNKLFWFLFIAFTFSYPIYRSVYRELPPPLPVIKKVPDFSLVNDFKKPVTNKDLLGKVYIANFIFTTCPSSCLRLTAEMEKVQKRVRGLGQNVALVSFTVDPLTDTPEVLYKYARKKNANPFVWSFLTGDKEELKKLVIDGFNVPMGDKEAVDAVVDRETVTMFDIAHTEKFVLVDHHGDIRGYYDSTSDDINKMMIDIGLLINRKN